MWCRPSLWTIQLNLLDNVRSHLPLLILPPCLTYSTTDIIEPTHRMMRMESWMNTRLSQEIAQTWRGREDSVFLQNRLPLSRMNIRKSLSHMKIRWGFAEVSTAFVHKGSRVYNHFVKSGTPNKCPYNTTIQLISAKWIYNIYTIKDMRGRHLPFLQLPSHQPKRGERNQCLWFLPHLWLHGHYRANIIVIDNVRIHLQVKSSFSPYPLQHQP